MFMRYFLSLFLVFSVTFIVLEQQPAGSAERFEVQQLNGLATVSSDDNVTHSEEEKDDELVPAKQAHEEPQKWVNIILGFILIFALVGFVVIGIIMKRSEK